MRHFSIKELERLSGIKAHTIRMWEQRHSVFSPQRTTANLRRYSLQDLRLLLNVSLLLSNGFKISKVAGVPDNEIQEKVAAIKDKDARKSRCINELVYYMYATSLDEFDEVLEGALLSWGFNLTIRDIVIPFLQKVDLLSYRNNSTEAHFVVTVIRRKIMFGIESLNPVKTDNRSVLLFLPKDEHYDLMLLFIFYMLKRAGLKPLYLGTNISLANLECACADKRPSLLFSYSYSKQVLKLKDYDMLMNKQQLNAQLYIMHAETADRFTSDIPGIQFVHYMDMENVI